MNSTDTPQPEAEPGPTRTWWHSLLARLLSFVLESYCDVRDEVLVGRIPLRLDVMLLRLRGRRPTLRARQKVPKLLALLKAFTFLEFKSPSDALERGDLMKFLACVLLWAEQQSKPPSRHKLSLIVVAPALNAAFRHDVRFLAGRLRKHAPGVYFVAGLPFATWVVETNHADANDPVLSLMSRNLLQHPSDVITSLSDRGHSDVVNFTVQQVSQFRHAEGFAMKHSKSKEMEAVSDSLLEILGKYYTREEVLSTIPTEERLKGLAPEQRLKGIAPDDFFRYLTQHEVLSSLNDQQRRILFDELSKTGTTSSHHN